MLSVVAVAWEITKQQLLQQYIFKFAILANLHPGILKGLAEQQSLGHKCFFFFIKKKEYM